MVAGGSCNSVEEHWHRKPKALGPTLADLPFFPALSLFQRSMDVKAQPVSLPSYSIPVISLVKLLHQLSVS